MSVEIIAAESLGVRSLCCVVTLPDRNIVIDPGIALGYKRHGLLPHPLQIAVGYQLRQEILQALKNATDVVFSHFHGDHVPLANANPYQLSIQSLPSCFDQLQCWSKSDKDLSSTMKLRFQELTELLGENLKIAEGITAGPLAFSTVVPHGASGNNMGTVMMTRIEIAEQVFVHASDIQLLDNATVEKIIDWQPDIVLASGPPLYLERLSKFEREVAWDNALRLAQNIDIVILDHHLMRSKEGLIWLDKLSTIVGKKVYCVADYMQRPRRLLEADRVHLYEEMPVPKQWHKDYAAGKVDGISCA